MTAAPALVSAVRAAKQYLTYVASGPFQYAVAEALALPDSYFDAFRADLLAKRDLLSAGLADAGFEVFRTGAPYVRFAFCKRTEVLADAAERLRTAFAH
ncbi:hypothetical protein SMA5143A_6754 [Streptomyces sp. MA5143a]|nr:hypothetical protein SMA5143A_6754 [Streptomyces sp. MA5143a]